MKSQVYANKPKPIPELGEIYRDACERVIVNQPVITSYR